MSEQRPSVLFHPELKHIWIKSAFYPEKWEAKYGDISGFGETPEDAMLAFDVAFIDGRNRDWVTIKMQRNWESKKLA